MEEHALQASIPDAHEFTSVPPNGRNRLASARFRFDLARPTELLDSTVRWRGMPLQEVRTSSAIERIAYNPATRDLSVWFAGNRRYIYADVPPELYDALREARSAGRFVNTTVKGRFASREHPPRRRYPS